MTDARINNTTASYMDGIFKSLIKSPGPDMCHIRGDELNKLIGANKYDVNKWYEMTNDYIVELGV